MTTTRTTIAGWLERAKAANAAYMVVVCDTFDYDDYPVFVSDDEDVGAVVAKFADPNNMQKVMEVYDLALSIEDQLAERRAWHLPAK